MSDTVLVAFATLASGAFASLLGAVGVYIASRHTAQSQIQQQVLSEYFSARLAAFSDVHSAYKAYAKAQDTLELRVDLLDVVNRACMVASMDTADALSKFASTIPLDPEDDEENNKFHAAKIVAIQAMDYDMRHFKMPELEK